MTFLDQTIADSPFVFCGEITVQGDAHAGSLIPVIHDGPVVQPCCRSIADLLFHDGLRIAVDPHRAIARQLREPRQEKMILRLPERCLDSLCHGPLSIPATPANRADDGLIVTSPQPAQRREQLLRSARKRASKVLRAKAAEIRKLVSTGRGRSARS